MALEFAGARGLIPFRRLRTSCHYLRSGVPPTRGVGQEFLSPFASYSVGWVFSEASRTEKQMQRHDLVSSARTWPEKTYGVLMLLKRILFVIAWSGTLLLAGCSATVTGSPSGQGCVPLVDVQPGTVRAGDTIIDEFVRTDDCRRNDPATAGTSGGYRHSAATAKTPATSVFEPRRPPSSAAMPMSNLGEAGMRVVGAG